MTTPNAWLVKWFVCALCVWGRCPCTIFIDVSNYICYVFRSAYMVSYIWIRVYTYWTVCLMQVSVASAEGRGHTTTQNTTTKTKNQIQKKRTKDNDIKYTGQTKNQMQNGNGNQNENRNK